MLLIGLPMVTVLGQECERSGVTYCSVCVGFTVLVFLVGSGNWRRELVVRVSALGKNEGEFGFLSVSLIVGLSR